MRATCLCLVALLAALSVDAAPAPDSSKQKLAALKKKLPDLVGDWLKKEKFTIPPGGTCKSELRVLRRLGANRAKAVILFTAFEKKGARAESWDLLLTVFLSYYDGCWTTETFDASCRSLESKQLRPYFAFLMMAIDEAAEK